jgi:hypothetical protein
MSIGKKSLNSNAVSGEEVVALIGEGLSYVKEDTVQMADDAKVVGGDNVESFGTMNKVGGDLISGHKLGDNSSLYLAQMDTNTANILQDAMNLVGLNSNNFMALSAGRDPDKPLADESNEITAVGEADPVKAWFQTTAGKVSLAAVFVYAAYKIWKGKK